MEFAREKGILFDRWIKACKVTDYNSLRELLLNEEFKICVPERTVLYLNEQKVNTVQQAAILADEYALMHKPVFLKRMCESGYTSQKENEVAPSDFKVRPSPYSPKIRKECGYCHKVGHNFWVSNFKTKQQRLDASRTQPHGSVLVKVVACDFCCSWQVFPALCVWRFCVTDWLCWGSESCENLAWHWGISVLHIVRYSAVLRRICVWYQYYCTEYWNGFYTCPSLSRF